MAIAISGACRTSELVNLKVNDVEQVQGNKFFVTLKDTKTHEDRQFMVTHNLFDIVLQYRNLRPANVSTDRFFIFFQNGKCRNQVIGKNTLSATPRRIATFLNLSDPNRYTGNLY